MSVPSDLKTWLRVITALYVFRILKRGPAYGNQISDEIRQRTNHHFNPNTNVLYPQLRRMEDRGFVISQWNNPDTKSKRIYTLTPAGLDYIPIVEQKVKDRLTEMEQLARILRQDLLNVYHEI